MNLPRVRFRLIFIAALIASASASIDFAQCFADIHNGLHGSNVTGGTDNRGTPVPDITKATAITYDFCVSTCGSGGGAFSWSAFSQQFSAWLLPWLALFSQFPFGSRYRWDNLMSVILALGSPCLAAYSLSLTVLNAKWVARRFANIGYPNGQHAVHILSSLQQIPLRVTKEDGLLASLVVLPENDPWWKELMDQLDYADIHTWTIAGVTSIAWVVIAYALTIVDAFSTISTDPNSNGQGLSGVGSLWLWMLPVTIGYLQLSPRCDAERVAKALKRANDHSYVVGPNGAVNADMVSDMRALSSHPYRESHHRDQEATAPIYNYARFLPFIQVVEEFASAFRYANENARKRVPVNSDAPWERGDSKKIHPANRRGSAAQVEAYCSASHPVRRSHWGPDVFSRFAIASFAALALQWSTTGASVLIVYFTPTVGLGCRSVAYLLYGAVATVIWALLVASSILAHYAAAHPGFPDRSQRAAAQGAVLLRRLAKLLATCNAAGIIAAFLLQFGNFFDRCYCNSDVLGLGKRAHNVMVLEGTDIAAMKAAWIGGVVLAVVPSGLFLVFINLFIDQPPSLHP
ncbi:hypothetical protein FB451DRAFT_1272047 [Mycena latifolia]|nr:hypothetical protein FB451DRAFT_1272047 [Mycena latifolia]